MKKTTAKHKKSFNLLKPELPPPSAWDRIYDWIVTRARVVVVVCEILIVLAFIGKVIVDIQAKDINEALEEKSTTLAQFFGTIEGELRDIQQRAGVYRNVWEFSNSFSSILKEVQSYITNPGVKVTITISGKNLTIRGDDNLQALQLIESQMKTSPNFKDVKLELNTESSEVVAEVGKYAITATILELDTRIKLDEIETTTDITQ